MIGHALRLVAYRQLWAAVEQQQAVFIAGFCAGGIGIAIAFAATAIHFYLHRDE